MKKTYWVLSVIVLILLLILLGVGIASAQQTTTNYTPISPTNDDLMRPDAGCNEWSYGQFVVPMPSATATNPTPLARYWRFTWLDFQSANGSPGSYDFTTLDAKIQESINKNQKFSFGVMQQCGGCDANLQTNIGGSVMLYPTWLHNQMQGESTTDYATGGEWFPNYNSPSYLSALKNLNVAINNHLMTGSYNGVAFRNIIGQIDIRGYGDYGEWTNNTFNAGQLTVGSGDSIISYHVHVYDKFQCVAMIATFDGNQLGNTMVAPAIGYYALTTKNSVGPLGLRRDNWGQTDGYIDSWTLSNNTTFNGIRFGDTIAKRYLQAPFVGEPQDGGSAGNFPNLSAQVQADGATSVGNGNFNNGTNATIQANFRAASKLMGYRIVVPSSSMTTTPTPGATYIVTLNWQNTNGIPAFDNWKCVYEWRNASNTVLQRDTGTFGLKGFANTTATPKTEIFTLRTVPAGTNYTLFLKVVDPTGYMHPMPLFITGVQPDGAYPLRTGITVAASGAVANAGTNINTSGTSVTLTSAGSVGANTQAWTQLSGPNTASLATPSAVTTTASGLITGTYVFQVCINGGPCSGQLISTVTVTVNAPVLHADAGNNQTITLPTAIAALTGSASTGTITSYSWTEISGPSTVTISNATSAVAGVSGLIAGTYKFQLSINGGASTAQTTVTVLAAPAGVANAGGDQTITSPTNIITLDGSGSTGTITTHLWSFVSGPFIPTIVNPGSVITTANGFGPGIYLFKYTVNGTSSDTVQLTVNPAVVPPPQPSGTTIFTTQTPNGGTLDDGTPITLGTKFQSKVKGYITGIRFYKTTGNTGTHIGLLYNRTGTELARATFVNETPTGWQWAAFATPVLIDSNTTYVAAYFSPGGFYTTTNGYFTTSVTNLPIIGLAKGIDGNNGVYNYGSSAAFPASYYSDHQPNYWVDALFTANNPGQITNHENHRVFFYTPKK